MVEKLNENLKKINGEDCVVEKCVVNCINENEKKIEKFNVIKNFVEKYNSVNEEIRKKLITIFARNMKTLDNKPFSYKAAAKYVTELVKAYNKLKAAYEM